MIDWDRVRNLRDDVGAEEFGEIVEIFLEEVQGVVDKLRLSPDLATLEHDLHFLKNGALNLGFDELSTLCQKGESGAATGAAEDVNVPEIVGKFDSSKAQFLAELPNQV